MWSFRGVDVFLGIKIWSSSNCFWKEFLVNTFDDDCHFNFSDIFMFVNVYCTIYTNFYFRNTMKYIKCNIYIYDYTIIYIYNMHGLDNTQLCSNVQYHIISLTLDSQWEALIDVSWIPIIYAIHRHNWYAIDIVCINRYPTFIRYHVWLCKHWNSAQDCWF